jgi:predicted AlkP superfamily phosphohydrolase/phosphomutase
VRINTFPNTELVPTLLTGVYPHEHGIWQVKLKEKLTNNNNILQKIGDKIPEIFVTTFQCFISLFSHYYEDLAAIPNNRLRRFEKKRFKYARRKGTSTSLTRIGKKKSIFGIVGESRSTYVFNKYLNNLDKILHKSCTGKYRIEMIELYHLDIIQHWNLNNTPRIKRLYKITDNFINKIYEKSRDFNITLMLLADHGMEVVHGSIDIKKSLKKLNLSQRDYDYFMEVPMVRFWFHTDKARNAIINMLSSIPNGQILTNKDMHKYNIKFDSTEYGEIYFIANPGYILFPNDFYHPVANIYLGMSDWQQRDRIFNPKHRGYHGYLPEHPSEKGFMLVLDKKYKVNKDEASIIDVAPTILKILDYKKADSMQGHSVFRR